MQQETSSTTSPGQTNQSCAHMPKLSPDIFLPVTDAKPQGTARWISKRKLKDLVGYKTYLAQATKAHEAMTGFLSAANATRSTSNSPTS